MAKNEPAIETISPDFIRDHWSFYLPPSFVVLSEPPHSLQYFF